MISVLMSGGSLPVVYESGKPYVMVILADGQDPLTVNWKITRGSTVVVSGVNNLVRFNPEEAETHVFYAETFSLSGNYSAVTLNFQVINPGTSVGSIDINYTRLGYDVGETIEAVINYKNYSGTPPVSVSWVLTLNTVEVSSGNSTNVSYNVKYPGTYKIQAVVVDSFGNTYSSNRSVIISGYEISKGGHEVQATLPVKEVVGTPVYLGSVYPKSLNGNSETFSALPAARYSSKHDIILLPGTDYIQLSLETEEDADDDVVARIKQGNFALRGFPTGLVDEDIGYGFWPESGVILPAPSDGCLCATFEVWNVSNLIAEPFDYSVRIRCFASGDDVYEYLRCENTHLLSGEGRRDRKFIFLFSDIEVELDSVRSGDNIFGVGITQRMSIPEILSTISYGYSSGYPLSVSRDSGLFFTESNVFCDYEPEDDTLPLFLCRGVAGISGYKPFYMTLDTVEDRHVVQRIKRLSGKMSVLMSGGGINVGSTIDADIFVGKSINPVKYRIPVDTSIYNDRIDVFTKVGDISIDLADFQFSNNGVVVKFRVLDSNA